MGEGAFIPIETTTWSNVSSQVPTELAGLRFWRESWHRETRQEFHDFDIIIYTRKEKVKQTVTEKGMKYLTVS